VQESQEARGLENWGEGEKPREQSFVLSPERRPTLTENSRAHHIPNGGSSCSR